MANEEKRIGLEQGRASLAYSYVEKVCEQTKEVQKEYKAHVKDIPMMIKTNGLGNTLAFAKSKSNKNKAYKLILEHILGELTECSLLPGDVTNEDKLVKHIVSIKSAEYRQLTIEIIALFNWLRRFADGKIKEDKNGGNKKNDR